MKERVLGPANGIRDVRQRSAQEGARGSLAGVHDILEGRALGARQQCVVVNAENSHVFAVIVDELPEVNPVAAAFDVAKAVEKVLYQSLEAVPEASAVR
jgi:hypothetical protein